MAKIKLPKTKYSIPYSRYQPSLRAPWCCQENITVTWSLRGQTSWIRGKIEFSSYVNKALLNSVFGNFQRSLKANSYFTLSYIYLSNIFIKTWEKKTVVPCTDVTMIEEIWTGKYSGDGFRLFRKFQFNDKLF